MFASPSRNSDERGEEKKKKFLKTRITIAKFFALHANAKNRMTFGKFFPLHANTISLKSVALSYIVKRSKNFGY